MDLFSRHGPRIPSGWVPAPDGVKEEILLVWQEDEMPEEIKNAPGYIPFTLSSGAEDWLGSMAEIKELEGSRGTVIIGWPRPAVPKERRSLTPEPAVPPPSPPVRVPAPDFPAPTPTISPKEWVRRQAPRNVPAIAERDTAVPPPPQPAPHNQEAHSLPAIGGEAPATSAQREPPRQQVRSLPQIGGDTPPQEPLPPSEQRTKPRPPPQIGPADEGC